MMESCLNNKADRREQVEVDDLKRDLSSEFIALPDVQAREHLQVYLRIRPFTSAESHNGESQDCVTIEASDTVLLKHPSSSLTARLSVEQSLPQTGQRFQFSQVYGPETTQKELFQGTVKDLVKDFLEGRNSMVFTYGVTNAGKTFTFLGPDADAGILPRSLNVIFSSIGERIFSGTSIKPHRCQEFKRLTREQQAEEAAFKRNFFRQFKESEKSNVSLLNSTNVLEGSSFLGMPTVTEDKINLTGEAHTKFSVWVSFCEIYNENIHDLLEVVPSGATRRNALRLSQDIKGNAFVKDLRWVQVNGAEEAYKVMKFGKKNQSFSSTRLNQLSSRSHSIFSVRILRIEDTETPRVLAVSELCLCDLAGSERCAKTQNKGERLKEAGNINTSLLILGKCINALRHNQQAKPLQHVPFRESKLTHYLQGFFCGRGKACMIVNINQCASMYDETLNVLKFSAVAQKVVVLATRPPPIMPQRSARDVSFIINNAERKALRCSRRSSLIGWDSSLEDVQEDEDDCEEETSLMEDTMDQTGIEEDGDESDDKMLISKKTLQRQAALVAQLQVQLKKERAESLVMEARVREEVSTEFSELFTEMQSDFNDRLVREREILEERAERRMEIFKNLIDKMATAGPSQDAHLLDTSLEALSSELPGLKIPGGAAPKCLGSGRAGAWDDGGDPGEELEGNVLELNEQQQKAQEQMAHKLNGEASGMEDEEKRRLLLELQEKSTEIGQLKEKVAELQEAAAKLASHETGRLQEVSAALEQEKRDRENTLAALEYQTVGREEALASLEDERKAREEALATLGELKRSKEDVLASLEAERRAKERAIAAHSEEEQSRMEEILSALAAEKQEVTRLCGERDKRQQEECALRQEVRELTARLEAAEHQVISKTSGAEQVLVQLQTAQAQLDEKTSQINSLMQEVQSLKEELQTPPDGGEEVSQLRKNPAEEEESKRSQVPELELQLRQAKEQLAHKQQISDQQLEQLTASNQQVEELRKALQEQEDEERVSKELRKKLEASEKQAAELNEKLQEQDVLSQQQIDELKNELLAQKAASDKRLDDLKKKLSDQEQTAELLKAELEETKVNMSKVSNVEATEAQPGSSGWLLLKEKEKQLEEKLKEARDQCAEKEAELQKKLLDKEHQVTSLQKSLREAQEQRDEEESRAVQETRHREVERRRELLAVAHEAIAQKDEELEKKAEEINRIKENAKQDSDKVKSLSLDLQRNEEQASDLREKLADYKKQVQQVQKEISSMREEEKVLRQKLVEVEKTKKQLQCDVASRDRTIQQLKLTEQSSDSKSDQTLYQKACKDLEAKERMMEDMRLALTEQEETQDQMEQVLENKLNVIQELSSELDNLKAILLKQNSRGNDAQRQADSPSDDLKLAKQEAAQAQESLKLCAEKHQAERKKWLEEKLSLIGQAKEAEDKRNQEMRKFAEDRERYARQQSQLESLSSQLAEKEQTMEKWRTERDTLVAALEVQLQKLLSSHAEKDKLIQQLRTEPPQERDGDGGDGGDGGKGDGEAGGEDGEDGDGGDDSMAELQAAPCEKELKEELEASNDTDMPSKSNESPVTLADKSQCEAIIRKSRGRRDTRASVSSQGSAGYPSVLESSEISTENGRTSRFPRPELEISFSPLQPNRMALRRQGEQNAVTVKITRSARKRKSAEMEKSHIFRRSKRRTTTEEEVEAENRRNTRSKLTPKLTPHQEEISSSAGRHNSRSSIHSRKEGTLQKIGEFLQSSPTLFGTKAKKMMSLVSGRSDAASSSSSSSLSLRARKSKRKLYRPEISSPMDMPSHPIISREPEDKESDHQIIKRRLRSRMVK